MPDRRISEGTFGGRRRRYVRSPASSPCALTPVKLEMLRFLAELRFLSLPQLARLCCPAPRPDLSQRAARRHLRALFDAGLVDVRPVTRAALAVPSAPNDVSLLYGSAPNLYILTAEARRLLAEEGLTDSESLRRPAPAYGPRNGLFLAHELAVRDVRVWLEETARRHGGAHGVVRWRAGEEAAVPLGGSRSLRPDAWFVYRLTGGDRPTVLVGLVEVDRGTERGDLRWQEKMVAYTELTRGDYLPAVTGYRNARALVFAPDIARCDRLAEMVIRHGEQAARLFWLTDAATLSQPGLDEPRWKRPPTPTLHRLLPSVNNPSNTPASVCLPGP